MIEVKIMIPILSSQLIFIIATSFILISIVQVLFYISFFTNLKNYLLIRQISHYKKRNFRFINFYTC